MLYGTIIGDIAGSSFEYLRHKFPIESWTAEELIYIRGARFTDDTVMTMAVAHALWKSKHIIDEAIIKESAITSMLTYGNAYINTGYGGSFRRWLSEKDPKPYGSFGNGAAMRISPVGWYFNDIKQACEVSDWITDVSHNHEIAENGAKAVVSSIILLRQGKSKDEVKEYIKSNYGYNLDCPIENIHEVEVYDDIRCDVAVTKALIAFLNTDSFGECIKTAINISVDTDTVAAIAGSIAEPYYIKEEDMTYIDARTTAKTKIGSDFKNIINKFASVL